MNQTEYIQLISKLNNIENKLDLLLNDKVNDIELLNKMDDIYNDPVILLYGCRPTFKQDPPDNRIPCLVITEDNRIPEEIKRLNPKIINRLEISDSNLNIRNTIFCNLDSLDEELYNLLKNKKNVIIRFYKIYNQHTPSFKFNLNLPYKTYFEGDL